MAELTPEQKPPEASVANDTLPSGRRRIPFSNAERKLEVPAIDGFHCHWFLERNVPRAEAAGYVFVEKKEVDLTSTTIGGEAGGNKGTDLGSRVSLIGDLTSAGGQGPERCYLMKIRQEWRNEDLEALSARSLQPMKAIFHDELIARPGKDGGTITGKQGTEYTRVTERPLFNRPARKAKIGRQT